MSRSRLTQATNKLIVEAQTIVEMWNGYQHIISLKDALHDFKIAVESERLTASKSALKSYYRRKKKP